MNYIKRISDRYIELFGSRPLIVRAPGRINLIGEHTDYNQGWVLPAAIDKNIFLAIGEREDDRICLYSEDYEEKYETSLGSLERSGKLWPDYILGVVEQVLKDDHAAGGFNAVFGGDIPLGAGLSSSAALECATAYGLNKLFGLGYGPLDMALKSQAAENEFVGVKCGLMDQFASIFGKKDHLIKLDCATGEHSYIPFKAKGIRVVLFDTQVKHSLASSAYNERRLECEKGVDLVRKRVPEANSLRNVSEDMLLRHVKPVNETVYRRCSYVVAEMERLQQACRHLQKNDFEQFGQRMFETHEGLKSQYEVSCPELDILVDLVKGHPAVPGARMMGGGFGGCTINLVREGSAKELAAMVTSRYNTETGLQLATYFVSIENGTELVSGNVPETGMARKGVQ